MFKEAQVILGFTQGEEPIELNTLQMNLVKKYGKTWEVIISNNNLVIKVTFLDQSDIRILVG